MEARRRRRRGRRIRGSGALIASAVLAIASVGAGVAVGQNAQSGAQVAGQGLLAQGSSGAAVTAVQNALGLRPSGVFDARMDAAVRRFQRKKGLLVDGIVGPQTRGALGMVAPAAGAATGTAPSAPLQQIAQCESGGNPQAIGGGGRYRGKYQFSVETWRSVGGAGDPAAAPEVEQDRRAAALYARTGSSSWPACG